MSEYFDAFDADRPHLFLENGRRHQTRADLPGDRANAHARQHGQQQSQPADAPPAHERPQRHDRQRGAQQPIPSRLERGAHIEGCADRERQRRQ